MTRDLVFGLFLFAVAAAFLAFAPPDDGRLSFLAAGWSIAAASCVVICRYLVERMDDPLDGPWVDPHARWGDP